jgi:shikimate kinase/3-dehydroquinate synthase
MALNALDRHVALVGFMGAGKSTLGRELGEVLDRTVWDVDEMLERATKQSIPQIFEQEGEEGFRRREVATADGLLGSDAPSVVSLGGGAVKSDRIRKRLGERALTLWVAVDVDTAWERVKGSDRPLAQDEVAFRQLYDERAALYAEVADARVRTLEDAVLAAAGIVVEAGALERLGELVPGSGRVALVADRHVAGIWGAVAQTALGNRLASVHELPPGEEAKSVASYQRLLEDLRLERGDTLVALGGGCTTDPAGFAAATYMRGIAWVSVPTTLVGQVDAGIGGKTGINLASGKNLVGAFHWPARVVVDPALLQSLPEQQRREGMAEVVKTGLLAGQPIWERDDERLVRACAAYKARVCLRDPRDKGQRNVLNLGHTFAHALEAAGAYGKPSHGEAVALGLLAATRLSVEHLGLDASVPAQVETLLAPQLVAVDRERAWAAIARDKKTEGGVPRLVLLDAPGSPRYGVELPSDAVRAALDSLIS